MYKFVTFLQSF